MRAFHGLLSLPSAVFVRRADVKDVGYVIVSDLFFTHILVHTQIACRTTTSLTIAKTTSIVSVVLGYVRIHWRLTNITDHSLQRAGMKGTSYTYFTTDNAKSARELINILREAKATVPPQLEEMSMFGGGGGRSKCCSTACFRFGLTLLVGRYGGGGGGRGRGGGNGGRYGGGGGGGYGGGHVNGYGGRNNDRW